MSVGSRHIRTIIWSICMAGAFVATHIPAPDVHRYRLPSDKLMHFLGFAALGIATVWRLAGPRSRIGLRPAVYWCLGLIAYGLFDEATQPIVGRAFQWTDWFADAAGAVAGMAAMMAVYRFVVIDSRRPQGPPADTH